MRCGLLGRTLQHSYSPAIHSQLGAYSYDLFEVAPAQLEEFLRQGDWDGLNVTIPYKQAVIPYLDELTPAARELGAVNTILRQNGKLLGHNTDLAGFRAMLKKSRLCVCGKKCLILGSGGAARVVSAVLREEKAQVIIISRRGENNYQNLHLHKDAALIVNATPVGMYPDTGDSPVDLSQFPKLEGVLDLIYNPARTKLLLDAEKRSLTTMNGLWMLVAQAKEASQWFQGQRVPDDRVPEIHQQLQLQMENLILIGMPGCGKSTIGKELAARTGRTFVDIDTQVVNFAQKSIPQIFAEDGEIAFRALETRVLAEWGNRSALVIATGGGCVTREENYPLLHQNGRILWLQRQIHLLPTKGRPLSQKGDLQQLYQHRKAMYEAFADLVIENQHTIEDTVDQILHSICQGGSL